MKLVDQPNNLQSVSSDHNSLIAMPVLLLTANLQAKVDYPLRTVGPCLGLPSSGFPPELPFICSATKVLCPIGFVSGCLIQFPILK